jgi:hypothetical protein
MGMWKDDTFVMENHSLEFSCLHDAAGGEPFTFEHHWFDGTAADREVMALGGFRGVTLDKWLSLGKEKA